MNEQHSSEVLDRLLQGAGVRRDAQLAELLGVSPQAVSQARRKGRIPDGWIVKIAARFGLSTDWVFFGRGTPRPEGEARTDEAAESGLQTPPSPPGSRSATSSGGRTGATLTRYAEAAPSAPPNDEGEAAIDMALVPLVRARLAAGAGSLETDADVVSYFAFRQDWLCRKGDPDRMVLMKVFGDSMEPDIRHGDMVLVDQGHTQIYGHAVYAVGVNEEIYIKQIETLPGGRLVLRSLNERYAPIEISLRGDLADSVRVIGRVIWWCREA